MQTNKSMLRALHTIVLTTAIHAAGTAFADTGTSTAYAVFETEEDFVGEIEFIIKFDLTRRHLQEIVDMPNRFIDLFIKCCLQNQGKLSKTKRHDHFFKLTDDEIVLMEKVVREFMLEPERNYFEMEEK